MPYYPQQYTWGDALGQIGQSLSQYAQVRDEREINKIKLRYGDNIEAWRQEALKNPQGEDGKWYKKYIGDPLKPLPEDPKMAQQRALAEMQRNLANDPNMTEEQRRMMAIASVFGPEVAGTYARMQGAKPTQADLIARQDKLRELMPNATPVQIAEKAQSDIYGTNPWKEYTTPGTVNPQAPFSALSPPVYDYNTKQVSPAEYEAGMGQNKFQIKAEDAKKRLQLAKDRFTALEENRKRIDARFEKTAKEREKRWNESLKYRMTPEQKMAYNASMKKYTQDFQLLNQTRKSAGEQLDKLKTKLAGMEANKSMVSGTDYEAQYNASMQQLETQIDALQKQYDDTEYALDGLAIPGEETVQGAPSAAPSSPRIPLR